MTKGRRFYGFARCLSNVLRCPAALIRLAFGRASFSRGKLLYRVGWAPLESDGDIPGRFPERHIGRSLRFRWRVDSFNRTGYFRNVAGGRLPPLRAHRWVVPFNRTGYNRNAPGTAHRPFSTVSLIGAFFYPTCLKTDTFVTSENCQLSIVHCQFFRRSLDGRRGGGMGSKKQLPNPLESWQLFFY